VKKTGGRVVDPAMLGMRSSLDGMEKANPALRSWLKRLLSW